MYANNAKKKAKSFSVCVFCQNQIAKKVLVSALKNTNKLMASRPPVSPPPSSAPLNTAGSAGNSVFIPSQNNGTAVSSGAPNPGVLSFFIMYCEGKARAARSLFQEEIVKPAPGSRQISLEDYQNVVRDLVVNQEMFDSMMRPGERPMGQFGPTLPAGRSFKCLRGATFALHQFCSAGTNIRFFLVTDPGYNSAEAQRKLATIYAGPFVDLVVRNEGISLRDLLNEPPRVLTAAASLKNQTSTNIAGGSSKNAEDAAVKAVLHSDQPPKLVAVLPKNIQQALRSEVLAILRSA